MLTKRTLVLLSATIAIVGFALAATFYRPGTETESGLVRPHAPVMGPANAPVTIVEFFDPACETCRAVYPFVKELLAQYLDDVRLVLRYAPFHEGSAEAVKIIEASRLQDKFLPVLEALLDKQPLWADHDRPDISMAWAAAGLAGLDLERARKDATRPEFEELLRQDVADIKRFEVRATPTFFVNGKRLASLGRPQLQSLVEEELKAARGTK